MRKKSKHDDEVEKLQNRELTFFIGAGVSALSGVPTWSEVVGKLDLILRGRRKKDYTSEELISIPEKFYLTQKDNPIKYYETIKSILDFEDRLPNKVHDQILLMNPRRIITTNFDDLIEKAVNRRLLSFKKICSDDQIGNVDTDPYILKVHGDFSKNNIVFRENDYLSYEDNFKLISNLLRTIFATDSVVFIGYSLNDYNIKLILDWAKRVLGDSFVRPYFVYTGKHKLSNSDIDYQSSRGLRLVDLSRKRSKDSDWIDRYLDSIEYLVQERASGNKTQYQIPGSVDYLYNKLIKLYVLPALRTVDIVHELTPYVSSYEVGVIEQKGDIDIFSDYFKYKLNNPKLKKNKTSRMILVIDRIISKTCVEVYNSNGETKHFNILDKNYGDGLLTNFDLYGMQSYIENELSEPSYKFGKAYYLAKLGSYYEAVQDFNTIAQESFKLNDYFKQYFSQINIDYLRLFEHDDLYWPDDFFRSMGRDYFKLLPISFQHSYPFISGYDNTKTFFSDAFKIVSKVNKIDLDSDTKVTTLGRPRERTLKQIAYELVNFSHQNKILDDEYSEYSEIIRFIYSTVINLENTKSMKWILSMDFDSFFHVASTPTPLSDFDLFCIINYFDYERLERLFARLNFNKFILEDVNSIYRITKNIIEPLKDSAFNNKYPNSKGRYQSKLKTLILLLCYIDINQDVLKYIIDKLLDLSLNSLIEIADIYVLIETKKKKSDISVQLLSDKLLAYLNKVLEYEISFNQNGRSLDQLSSSGFDYFDFVNLIDHGTCLPSTLEQLNTNIEQILVINKEPKLIRRMSKLSEVLNNKNITTLISILKARIRETGDFQTFEDLVMLDTGIASEFIPFIEAKMKIYVEHERIRELRKNTLPLDIRYSELIRLFGTMFINDLTLSDKEHFMNLSHEIDFYLNPYEFDYEHFEIKWIYKIGFHGLTRLCTFPKVKAAVSKILTDFIVNKKLSEREKASLVKIYFSFFV